MRRNPIQGSRWAAATVLAALVVLLSADAALARTETLVWTYASPGLIRGFEIMVGSSPGDYGQVLNVGMATPSGGQTYTADIDVADNETVYLAVRSYASDGRRSQESNERRRVAPTNGSGGSGSGSGGGTTDPGGSDPGSGGSFPLLQSVSGESFPHGRALYAEDFESGGLGAAVSGWVDTGADMSLVEDDSLFQVEVQSGNRVLATSSTATNVHSHYLGSGSDSWSDYVLTGAMGITSATGGVGVTAYSQFDDDAAYYRLRRYASRDFELSMRPGVACSDPGTGVTPSPGRWYRFRIRVESVGQGTRVRARVWRADRNEPNGWQADCLDTSTNRLAAGTIGVWSMGPGSKHWDEFQVVPLSDEEIDVEVDPEFTAPAPGSTLAGRSATFSWRQSDGLVTEWWLYVGTSRGGKEILDSGALGAGQTSLSVGGLPSDGSPVYARLFYRRGGGSWLSIESTVQAALIEMTTPAMTAPIPGGVATGARMTFRWSDPSAVATQYWLYVGSSVGGAEYWDSGLVGAAGTTVSGLPTDGRTLNVRLWYRKGSEGWRYIDSTIQAVTLTPPAIASPAPGATIGSGQTFRWSDSSGAIDEWWLYLGSAPGRADILDSGSLGAGTSYQVGNLPSGGTIHARLFYRSGNDKWSHVDSSYQATGPRFTYPSGLIENQRVRFIWSAGNTNAQDWWVWLGTTPGAKNLLDSGNLGTQKSVVVDGLPLDGSKVYARLWFRNGAGSGYTYLDHVFASVGPGLLNPAPGSTLPGSTATFTWSSFGAPVLDWWVYLGSQPGDSDLLDSGYLGNATSLAVDGLPTDGQKIYVRVWYRTGAQWVFRDSEVTAAP